MEYMQAPGGLLVLAESALPASALRLLHSARRILRLLARLSAVHDSYFPETKSQRGTALSFLLNGNYQIGVRWISCVHAL